MKRAFVRWFDAVIWPVLGRERSIAERTVLEVLILGPNEGAAERREHYRMVWRAVREGARSAWWDSLPFFAVVLRFLGWVAFGLGVYGIAYCAFYGRWYAAAVICLTYCLGGGLAVYFAWLIDEYAKCRKPRDAEEAE